MADLVFCEPTELYNILNQASKLSRLTEPNYLCLLDVRPKREYDEGHLITALRVKKKKNQYLIPESVDLECVKYCVVYDSNTNNLDLHMRDICLKEDDEDGDADGEHQKCSHIQEFLPGPAVEFGQFLTDFTRQPVNVLKGGYEFFSGMYHFLRTQKIIWMPQELDEIQPYPIEIIPGRVFLGDFRQANDPKIHKDLKIKAHVNISMESTPFFVDDPDRLLHVQIEDVPEAALLPYFRRICHFMEIHLYLGSIILVFSTRGISRSSAALVAFLMHNKEATLKRSWAHVKKCKANMRPNRGLVTQLSEWEKTILGDYITDISEPIY
uniref:serine/threonine/tyrosine-interacting-like protein 1 n=1 Tax=Jaculus jaculus TaxID=51337 RepID=UPI001E1B26C4|nr:serine/threonine/tyrosine-interacting-like protein 1 [Jaculus jaculus]